MAHDSDVPPPEPIEVTSEDLTVAYDPSRRHEEALRRHIQEAARHAMVPIPTATELKACLGLPQARAVLELLDRGVVRGLDPLARASITHRGTQLLRQWVAMNLGFASYIVEETRAAGDEVDEFVIGYQDSLEHLLRRFRQ